MKTIREICKKKITESVKFPIIFLVMITFSFTGYISYERISYQKKVSALVIEQNLDNFLGQAFQGETSSIELILSNINRKSIYSTYRFTKHKVINLRYSSGSFSLDVENVNYGYIIYDIDLLYLLKFDIFIIIASMLIGIFLVLLLYRTNINMLNEAIVDPLQSTVRKINAVNNVEDYALISTENNKTGCIEIATILNALSSSGKKVSEYHKLVDSTKFHQEILNSILPIIHHIRAPFIKISTLANLISSNSITEESLSSEIPNLVNSIDFTNKLLDDIKEISAPTLVENFSIVDIVKKSCSKTDLSSTLNYFYNHTSNISSDKNKIEILISNILKNENHNDVQISTVESNKYIKVIFKNLYMFSNLMTQYKISETSFVSDFRLYPAKIFYSIVNRCDIPFSSDKENSTLSIEFNKTNTLDNFNTPKIESHFKNSKPNRSFPKINLIIIEDDPALRNYFEKFYQEYTNLLYVLEDIDELDLNISREKINIKDIDLVLVDRHINNYDAVKDGFVDYMKVDAEYSGQVGLYSCSLSRLNEDIEYYRSEGFSFVIPKTSLGWEDIATQYLDNI